MADCGVFGKEPARMGDSLGLEDVHAAAVVNEDGADKHVGGSLLELEVS